MLKFPAEFEPQRAVWLTWPGNPDTWPDCRREAERAYAGFAAAVSRFQPVEMICGEPWQKSAKKALEDAGADLKNITFHDWPVNDAWCRDHGPLFVKNEEGNKEVVDFIYNAWGGKFSPWDADDAVAGRVSEVRNLPRQRVPAVGEGGALEVNSNRQMITTESVWLNANRNPDWTRGDAEACFRRYLGVEEILWLREGLIGDDTDGHIDTLSRFVDDDTVVTCVCAPSDPNYRVLSENRERLQERFRVAALPLPEPLWKNGARLPATYANFLILNEGVLVPTYARPEQDDRALGILKELFPGRQVAGLPCEVLIREGGALHCLSMQEPV